MNDFRVAVKANTAQFSSYIDSSRALFDAPSMSLIEVDLPEYARNGIGRALMRVMRYHLADAGCFALEGVSIAADSSRGHVIYQDMNPVVLGSSHAEIQAAAPPELIAELYQQGLPIELVTLGALRCRHFDGSVELLEFIDKYHGRASWMEAHALDVIFSNLTAADGDNEEFNWNYLLKENSGV